MYEAPNGDTICRAANVLEREELDKIVPRDLRPINHLEEKGTGPAAASHGGQHLKIILRATANLEANAAAKAAFIRAAAAWENIITSPVTIYLDVDFATTNFGAAWPQGVLASTSSPAPVGVTYSAFRSNLINGADTAAKLAVYNALPPDSLPTDAGAATTVAVSRSIARATGLLSPTAQESDAAARIGFNANFSYDFDRSDGVSNGRDFEGVAAHEIGHALGFTSRSGATTAPDVPAVWDLFRFRSGTTNGTFTTAQRIMTLGGPTVNSQYYFVPFPGSLELGLSDGGPDGVTTNNADGNQSSHWRQQDINGNVYIGIMDPRIPLNTRRDITPKDIEAINIFGYNSIIPAPPPNDNFASAQTIIGCSGSVMGSNVSSTHESGEPNHLPPDGGSRSIWYQWQAPATGEAVITTAGSTFDTVLAVYIGNAVNSLTLIGNHDDVSNTDKTSRVTFTAVAGTTYRVAVDGFNNFSSGGDVGPVTLNWSLENCNPGSIPQLKLMLAEGVTPAQSASVDSVLLITDPFPVINSGNLINPASDRNTRVVVFVSGLSLASGQPASSVVVNLIDSNNQPRNIAAEDVRTVPNFDFSQVTFRLPDDLVPGTYEIKIVFSGASSNTATIRIRTP